MKKKIIAILSLVLILSFTIVSAKEYSDISDHWALEYIMDMTNQGILQGYPDGTFKAEEDVSYGEFITALNRLVIENYEEKAGDGWSKHAIDKAQEAGYVRDTDFNPNDPIDRDTVFHYIYMCFRPEANESVLDKFTDTDDLKYRVDASALVNSGIVLGYPDGTIKPKETITRAETAKLLKELGDFRLGHKLEKVNAEDTQAYNTKPARLLDDYKMDGGYKLEGDFYSLTEEGYGEFFHRIYDQDFGYKKGDLVLVYGEKDGNYRFTLDQEDLDYTIRGKIPKDKVEIIETDQETKEVIDFK